MKKTMSGRSQLLQTGFALLIATTLAACGSTKSGPTRSYAGAGSEWAVTLSSDASFALTHAPAVSAAVDLTVNGTYDTTTSGFTTLTVTSAVGSGSGSATAPAAGSQIVGLEVIGSALFLQPTTTGSLIAMVPSGACPSADLSLNWTLLKPSSTWTDIGGTFGTLTFDPTTNIVSLPQQFGLTSVIPLAAATITGNACNGGVITVAASGESDLFLAQAGGASIHTNVSGEATGLDQVTFAMPVSSGATAANVAGTYAGLVYDATASVATAQNFPISLVLTASGSSSSGPGTMLSNVTTGVAATSGVKLTLNAAGPVAGSLTGTIDFGGTAGGGTTKDIACNVQQGANGTSGTILTCAAEDTTGAFYSMVLVTK